MYCTCIRIELSLSKEFVESTLYRLPEHRLKSLEDRMSTIKPIRHKPLPTQIRHNGTNILIFRLALKLIRCRTLLGWKSGWSMCISQKLWR